MTLRGFLITGLVVLLLAAAALFAFPHYAGGGSTKTGDAVVQSRGLLHACEAYHLSNANQSGKFPTALADLHKPPFGGGSYLKNGEHDLIDPWGQPYRYAVIPKSNDEYEVYVWAERNIDGKLKLIGTKRKTNGEMETFGFAE